MRPIDADALTEAFYQKMKELLKSTDTPQISKEALSLLCGASLITDAPTIEPPRWILVSEALPDRGKTVLITNDKGNVRCGRFRGVEFWKDDGDAYWTFKGNTVEHVLAWMPLPPSYKGGQDGQ